MAIDPNIPLMARGIDLGQVLTTGLQGAQSLMSMRQMMEERERQKRLQPIQNKILQAELKSFEQKFAKAEEEAQILKNATTAQQFLPSIKNKDLDSFQRVLSRRNLPQQEAEYLSTLARAGRWDQLNDLASNEITVARQRKLLASDLGETGYVPAAVRLSQERQKLLEDVNNNVPGAQDKLDMFDTFASRPTMIPSGGGTMFSYQPLTRLSTEVPIGEAFTPRGTAQPMGPGQALEADFGRETPAERIRRLDAERKAAVETGTLDAKTIAELRRQTNSYRSNLARFNARFKDLDVIGSLRDMPGSGMSAVLSKNANFFIGNMKSEAALSRLEPLVNEMVKLEPFPPGAQSVAELEARQKTVGDILKAGTLTPEEKYQQITSYFDGIRAQAQTDWEILNETRIEQGLKPLATPFDFMRKTSEPSTRPEDEGRSKINRALEIIRKNR